MEFSVIVLTEAGDFLLEDEEQVHREDRGVEIEDPWIFNEDEKVQRIKADNVFVPYTAIQNIQYGNFEQETLE